MVDLHFLSVSTAPYIMLEDIASRFNKPCIMDVKVVHTYTPMWLGYIKVLYTLRYCTH